MNHAKPRQCGYRWPAEWEPHAATWLAWPHNRETWPGAFERIPAVFEELVRTVARFEPVHILAGGEAVMRQAARWVGHLPNVTLHDIPTNDAWTRDHGPTFLSAAEGIALVDWRYNAWGGKYPPFDLDNAVPARIAQVLGCPRLESMLVMEGGSLEGNGGGTVMTTESCLLHPGRNPDCTAAEIEQALRECLGAQRVLWLPGGDFAGDDTDGHIDQLARFVDARTVLIASAPESDSNHAMLLANQRYLQGQANQDGEPLRVVELPLPQPLFSGCQPLPASYCNFYILNRAVIVPQFDDPADGVARQILSQCFPDREICGIDARELVKGLGAVHCLTQQQCA